MVLFQHEVSVCMQLQGGYITGSPGVSRNYNNNKKKAPVTCSQQLISHRHFVVVCFESVQLTLHNMFPKVVKVHTMLTNEFPNDSNSNIEINNNNNICPQWYLYTKSMSFFL
ncbi:hypothetical protein XENORESO_006244 [Xenotaenia resolanae]|uniref:Uncharacterized protein n=1 Tax=Xenotaenia resolanae TaxID=208358 RepID=A0ABV0W1D2_9TELE